MSLKGTIQSFKVLRGEGEEADLASYELELDEGMVVLDVIHQIQAARSAEGLVASDDTNVHS